MKIVNHAWLEQTAATLDRWAPGDNPGLVAAKAALQAEYNEALARYTVQYAERLAKLNARLASVTSGPHRVCVGYAKEIGWCASDEDNTCQGYGATPEQAIADYLDNHNRNFMPFAKPLARDGLTIVPSP